MKDWLSSNWWRGALIKIWIIFLYDQWIREIIREKALVAWCWFGGVSYIWSRCGPHPNQQIIRSGKKVEINSWSWISWIPEWRETRILTSIATHEEIWKRMGELGPYLSCESLTYHVIYSYIEIIAKVRTVHTVRSTARLSLQPPEAPFDQTMVKRVTGLALLAPKFDALPNILKKYQIFRNNTK